MRTAIYVRVSTTEQAKEGYSVSGQKNKLQSFCESQDWEVAGLYADEGISAKNTDRPELKRMLADIKKGDIDCVLVYRLDRLTRSVFDLYKLLETFEEYDCKFKSATEIYDTTTATGRMFITLVASFAQFERESMGERVQLAMLEKARQGKWTNAHVPFGYNLDKSEFKLYINHEEAVIVRKIFDMYKNMGMNTIATYLNERQMLTRKRNKWSDNTIMRVLRNPVYCGYLQWSGETHKAHHEPIISEEEFSAARDLANQRKRTSPRSVSSPYIFSKKLKCPKCGNYLVGNPSKSYYKGKETRYLNYRCREVSRGNCSGTRQISERKIEESFIEYMKEINFDDVLNDISEPKPKDDTEHLQIGLNKTLEKIEKRKKKWQYAWSEDAISFDDFKKRMEEERQKEEQTREELKKYEKEYTEDDFDKEQFIEVLKDIKRNWLALEPVQKKELLNLSVRRIHFSYVSKSHVVIDNIDFV